MVQLGTNHIIPKVRLLFNWGEKEREGYAEELYQVEEDVRVRGRSGKVSSVVNPQLCGIIQEES